MMCYYDILDRESNLPHNNHLIFLNVIEELPKLFDYDSHGLFFLNDLEGDLMTCCHLGVFHDLKCSDVGFMASL